MRIRFLTYFLGGFIVLTGVALLKFIEASAQFKDSAPTVRLELRRPASINRGVQALATPSRLFYGGETFISADLIEIYHQQQREKAQAALVPDDFIPMDMSPTNQSDLVLTRIADQSLATMLRSAAWRESSLGRAADEAQTKMKAEIRMVSKSPKVKEHRMDMQLKAFQNQAEIRYTGVTEAILSYDVKSSKTQLEVVEKMSGTTELVLGYESMPSTQLSRMVIRWPW
jgi:hypothetical protein